LISMEKEKRFLILLINYKIVVSFSLNQMLKFTKVSNWRKLVVMICV
jgi:hypothetical protein